MDKIKAIIFDLGGVLFVNKEGDYMTLEKVLGVPYAELAPVIDGIKSDMGTGKMDARELLALLKDEFDIQQPVEELYAKWQRIYEQGISPINEELLGWVDVLKKNYKVYIFSNTIKIHTDVELKERIFAKFDAVYKSFEEHVRKPEVSSYLHVAGKIGLKLEECVFIDDLPENVKGANKAGMKGLQFVDNAKLKKDLEELGIVI